MILNPWKDSFKHKKKVIKEGVLENYLDHLLGNRKKKVSSTERMAILWL